MGSWLFGSNSEVNNPQPPAAGTRLQSSVEGKPIPVVYGQVRLAGNLIWYGDFAAIPINMGDGGKGGPTGGSGKGDAGGGVIYWYYAGYAIALCEGPISNVLAAFVNKAQLTVAQTGLTFFNGAYTQSPWGYLVTAHPSEALNYRGLAYMAGRIALGQVTEIPNYSFEVLSAWSYAVAGIPDANPKDVVVDLLTNTNYGVNFPSARLDTAMTQASNYWRASGLLVSMALLEQKEASGIVEDLMQAVNASPRWSGGMLTVVPWGDAQVVGNGVTYDPEITPLYDITEDDLLPNQGGDGASPVQVRRKRKSEMINDVKLEYLSRVANYDPVAIDAKDQASIDVYGLRPDLRQAHMFALAEAAGLSAQLQLNREQIGNEYTFTLGPKFILPDVEDILTLTRYPMNMYRKPIRITEITENEDGSLTFLAEDFFGTASAPAYGAQAPEGHTTNTNVDPGSIADDPIIFEPTAALLGGADLAVWGAICGENPTLWGGCNVYASFDDINYEFQGVVHGAARMGRLSAPLASVNFNPTGQTVDTTNTLEVDLTESQAALTSGTEADALALATASYVDGEIIAYAFATLTATYNYDLDYLVRGAYGTEAQIVTHDEGAPYARLDTGIFKVPFEQTRIGQTVYLKFQSFNLWGGGLQDMSTLGAVSYVIQGSALKSPIMQVENVRSVYKDGFLEIWWDDVADFRTGIRYKIYKGDTFAGAQQVGDNAHAPFIAFGNGTYWIVAYCQPVPELFVYSEDPASITISGNMLIANLVYQSDQQAAGWPGYKSNGVGIAGPNLQLGGAGDILSEADFLAIIDLLGFGGIVAAGTYEVLVSDWVDVGYVADCYVNATWLCSGVPHDQNILTIEDFLGQPDILGAASTQYVDCKVQVATAQTNEPGDLYDAPDLYAVDPDLYTFGIQWLDWQDMVPGVYRARMIKFRLVLTTVDPNTTCVVQEFSYQVSVPARIDHYPNLTVPSGGLTVVYEPDDASTPAPFNGGPPVGGVANQPLPFLNFSVVGQAGLAPVIDAQSLSEVTFHFEDSVGTPTTVDDCSLIVEGY